MVPTRIHAQVSAGKEIKNESIITTTNITAAIILGNCESEK